MSRASRLSVVLVVAVLGAVSAPLAQAGDTAAGGVAAEVRLVPREGRVALTFDDGPHPVWTPVILDVLDEYGVTATFFVTGFRAEQHPELVAEIVRRGHSVQPHGWAHARMTDFGSGWVASDLERNVAQIVAAGAPQPTCFRPPYGVTNARVTGVAGELGLDVVLWDVDSRDYVHASVDGSVRSVTRGLGAGDVVLMHDLYGWVHRESLPQIIGWVRSRGLRFDTICDERPAQRFGEARLVVLPTHPI